MKVKMKLDPASIKNWLLAHGEKVALAVVALVFCMFVYSTLGRESLEDRYEPDKLTSLAGTVEGQLTSSKWDPSTEQLKVVNYANRAKTEEVKLANFPLPNAFNPPVVDQKAKRGEPEIFGPDDLRVAAGVDSFALKVGGGEKDGEAGATAALKAQPWAVVTGLVPVAQQQQAYLSTFANAISYDPKADTPQYLKPILERQEVTAADPNAAEWKEVDDPGPFEKLWRNANTEIISKKYYDNTLTAPLGDLPGGKWGESVAHPKVPLEGEELPPEIEEVRTQGAQSAPVEDEEVDADAQRKPAAAAPGRQPRAAPRPAQASASTQAAATDDGVAYVLLRAFDYTVERGKRYRYRVKLQVANPNAGKHPRYLKDPQSAEKTMLHSEPSEPTSVVTIPDGHNVLAGPVESGTRYSEPTATILVTTIDAKTGFQAAAELKEVRRGAMANTPPATVMVRDPLNNSTQQLDNMSFKSNITVLDIHGGRKLSHRMPIMAPGEILLLDANGNLTTRSEIEDEKQYEAAMPVKQEEKPAGALEDPQDKIRVR